MDGADASFSPQSAFGESCCAVVSLGYCDVIYEPSETSEQNFLTIGARKGSSGAIVKTTEKLLKTFHTLSGIGLLQVVRTLTGI